MAHAVGVCNGNFRSGDYYRYKQDAPIKPTIIEEIMAVVLEVRDLMKTQAEYDAWWASTPDDNKGFLAAAKLKLRELKSAEGTAASPVISGGEIVEVEPVLFDREIPY